MDQEAADELGHSQQHDFLAITGFDAVLFPTEGHHVRIGGELVSKMLP